MSVYLKQFSTHSEYEQYINGSDAILPNVSICTTEGDVHYNPYVVDPYAGHDYVEIGGLKWAIMNVGANSITDTGLYFQWGDTQGYTAAEVGTGSGQKAFKWEDYKYGNGTSSPGATGMTKYNDTDSKTVLDTEDDAVQAAWGGNWRMPTEADFQALSAATTNAWTSITVDNVTVSGRMFTDKTDASKTLFFPAAGRCFDGSVSNVGSYTYGFYWSSSLVTSDKANGRDLYFGSGSGSCNMRNDYRRTGFSVRGVVG